MHESSKLTGVLGAARDEYDLALGVHGKLASVGAGMDDENGFDAGAAYVYRLIDSQWVLEAKLLAPDRQLSDGFGRTVAIGGDVAIIGAPFDEPECCYHSRALFKAIGERFDILDRRTKVIMADVLNAWLDPAPCVITALREHLPWLVRTSPLTDVRRLQETIAETRGVAVSNVLPGAGSSDLIYLACGTGLRRHRGRRVLTPRMANTHTSWRA